MILISFLFLSLFSSENFVGLIERVEEERTSDCFLDKDNNFFKISSFLSQLGADQQGSIGIIKDKKFDEKDSTNIQY